ncbi:hypothetical protein D3C81_1085660 [compost metagenome]
MQGQHAQVGGEAFGLVQPVGDQAGRHHHQRRRGQAAGLFFQQHVGQRLQGFAEAHVVGEDAAGVHLTQRLHPAQAFVLVGAQLGAQAFRQRRRLAAVVAQALGDMPELLAALPVQWQFFQIAEPRGVGRPHAQPTYGRLLGQIELGQRADQRLQAGERHGDADRPLGCRLPGLRGIAPGVQAQHQLLVVGVAGEGDGVEQGGGAADQFDQRRQQADALAVDLDAQLQVEPLPIRGFLDLRVPFFDFGQVEDEFRADIHFPALLAQGWQAVAHEGLPGGIVGQFVHFAGAVFQGVAAAHRRLEAEPAQFQAQRILLLQLAADADDAVVLEHPQLLAGARADGAGDRGFTIEEGEGGAVPGDVLHAPAAQVEAAVHVAAQGQARTRRDHLELGWRR